MNGIQTFRELQPNRLVQVLVSTIMDKLDDFPHSEEFENVLAKKKNENQHSHAFCLFMGNSCQFSFIREIAQKRSHSIDIGVYNGALLIFVIEAKLLPTPSGTKQKPRYDHEYVYGKGAGIQRFKDGDHGLDNDENLFSDSGMIAYVKEQYFNFWFKLVNQWILDAKWQASEQLEKIKIEKTAVFQSDHLRIDGSMIRLYHFWVKV
ncbi:MAG: hypothetical protein SF052_05380 [Bacteroidia bacterium]|nr:hypothetical protein [Bacteroidia bacterium]